VTAIAAAAARLDGLILWCGTVSGWKRLFFLTGLGALLTLGLPPADQWWLLYACFPVLVWCLAGCTRGRTAFAIGWWFAFGYFVIGLYWINNAFLVFAAKYWFLVPIIGLGLPAILALFGGGATLLAWHCRGPVAQAIGLAAAWAGLEWLRGHIFTGFPWNLAGHAWSGDVTLMQTAAWLGPYGMSLLVLLSATLPAGWAAGKPRTRWLSLGSCILIVAACWSAGAARLAGAPAAGAMSDAGIGIRIVQANIPQSEKWKRDYLVRNFERHLDMSTRDRPDWIRIVVWPETATPFFVIDDHPARSRIAEIIPPDGYLMTGTPRRQRQPAQIWNSMAVIDDSGLVAASYDKFHLVPLGEYVPLKSLLPLPKVTAGALDYSAGPGPQTLVLPAVPPVSPLICYEIIFPGAVTDRSRPPAWLLNLTNDAWYGLSAGPYQHLATARLRAVELGIPLIRAANTGISAVVDSYGRILDRIPLDEAGIMDFRLPAPASATPWYGRFGDGPFAGLLLLSAVLAGLISRQNGRF